MKKEYIEPVIVVFQITEDIIVTSTGDVDEDIFGWDPEAPGF